MPPLTDYIHRILNSSDPLKFAYTASSYKPFVSLFNVTGVAQMNNTLAGVGKSHSLIRPTISGYRPFISSQWTSPDRSLSKSAHLQQLAPSSDSTSRTARPICPTTPTGSWVHPPETSPSKPLSITSLRLGSKPYRNGAHCAGTTIPAVASSCKRRT